MAQQLTNGILNAAFENLTAKKQEIDTQIAEIKRMLGNRTDGSSDTSGASTRQHRISPAGRRAIAAAQKRRWATAKGASAETAQAPAAAKPKRKLSAAGRRAIVAALKKRWAAKRAEAGKAGKTTARKATRKSAAKRAAKKAPEPATTGISQ